MTDLHDSMEKAFHEAQRRKVFSGASLLVADPEKVIYERAFGTISAGGPPLSLHSPFDLASLTKPLATTLVCMHAVAGKILDVHAPISHFISSDLVPEDKRCVSLLHLLNHCSGLPPYVPFYRKLMELPFRERKESLLLWILQMPLTYPAGKDTQYSDLDFMLLGLILEKTLGDSMDRLFRRVVQTLLMEDGREGLRSRKEAFPHDSMGAPCSAELHYVPLETVCDPSQEPKHFPAHRKRAYVATEHCPWRKRMLQGEVHDENAYALEGVAPHAGLFGTAASVHRILSVLWKIYEGELQSAPLNQETLRFFWTQTKLVPQSTWALGFDSPSPAGSSAGRYFSEKSVGHLGFTGTSFWLDPVKGLLVILLTNRVHICRHNDRIKLFRPHIHDLIMEKMT